MAKFCLSCGDALGTRQLMHDARTCDRCRAQTGGEKSKSGLLHFVENVERAHPLAGTGRLTMPGADAER